jgi:tRNA-guanine family transglycosylase
MYGDRAGNAGEAGFSRAYIRHLFFAEEMLGPILVSVHNLRHFQRFMADLRRTIVSDGWDGFLARWPVATARARAQD